MTTVWLDFWGYECLVRLAPLWDGVSCHVIINCPTEGYFRLPTATVLGVKYKTFL